MQEEINRRIGDYEVLNRLGAGGMGEVYKVRNVISDRVEAMKVLLPSLAGNKSLDDRFAREIKLVASLNHPNIASLCTAMTIENRFVMVMEYVEGVTIESLIEKGPIPVDDSINYVDQALAALGFAHSKGIIHRDIKPANFMLTSAGVVKLMDFGIARGGTDRALTQTGAALGTYDYMSPEQIMGQHVDARSDLYAMGISMYEMVTGTLPYKNESSYKVMDAHLNQAPRHPVELQPWLPARLNAIILQLIAKAPEERFQNADELRSALRTVDPRGAKGTVVESARSGTVPESQFMPQFQSQAGRGSTQIAVPGAFEGTFGPPTPNDSGVQKIVPMAVPPSKSSKAPLWIGLAVLAIAAAGAAGFLLNKNKGNDSSSSGTPAVASGATGQAGPPPGTGGANGTKAGGPLPNGGAGMTARPGPSQAGKVNGPQVSGKSNVRPSGVLTGTATANVVITGPPQPPPLTAEEQSRLDEAEEQVRDLNSHAVGLNQRLNAMESTMASRKMTMRDDVLTHQASMNSNLNVAKQAVATRSVDRAETYAKRAKVDEDFLDSFLH